MIFWLIELPAGLLLWGMVLGKLFLAFLAILGGGK